MRAVKVYKPPLLKALFTSGVFTRRKIIVAYQWVCIMRSHVEPLRSSSWCRLAILAALAASVSACSSDVNRFTSNSTYSNPYGAQAKQGASPSYAQGSSSHVVSQPLPQPGSYQQSYSQPAGSSRTQIAATTGSIPRASATSPASDKQQTVARAPAPAASAKKDAATETASSPAKTAVAAAQPEAQPQRLASLEPTQNAARMLTPAKDTAEIAKNAVADEADSASGFRWPVRGRVISGFGPKPTGQQNDGINLAVPEGTPIKAADDGVVAYAGNELKGYGNLVLIRHSSGYVTAYAHASELLVKRGDSVKRGQVVAKSGQTGNVNSPQLHFEVRKGSTPVDPMQHLVGAT